MTQNISQKLLLLAALIAVAAGQRCLQDLPFTRTLVGKRFSKLDDCFRPSTSSEIRVNQKTFVLTPFIIRTFTAPVCPEKYVFHFRRDGKDPFVVYFPEIDFPGDFESITPNKLERFCEKEHMNFREKYFPVGDTRKRFKESVRTMIEGTKVIRDFECEVSEEGFVQQKPGRGFENVDLDGIVTYLLGVAYHYNFCAEF